MRLAILILCVFSLTGCGLAKRFIPRPSPRVILTGGTIISKADIPQVDKPCTIREADIVLASYYAGYAGGFAQRPS